MRKIKLPIVAVATLTAINSYAQTSVTLYGVVDAGFEYVSNAVSSTGGTVPATATGQNFFGMQGSNQSGSRWGLRGVEDLGGGLNAIFVLESGFLLDNGTSTQSGRLFGRGAYLGLRHAWGQLSLGRHTTPMYDFGLIYDPMTLSSRYSIGAQDPFMGSARADNSAKYIGTFGGLNITGLYSFNNNNPEIPGNFTNGRQYAVSANYTIGSVALGAAYDQTNSSAATALRTNSLIRRAAVGGTYRYGPVKAFLGYRYAHAFNGASLPGVTLTNTVSNLFWSGVAYQITPALSLTGAAYYQNLRNAQAGNPWEFITTLDYTLSKRTDVYTSVAYVLNRGKSSLAVNGFNSQLGTSNEAVQPGANQLGAVVGIRHKF